MNGRLLLLGPPAVESDGLTQQIPASKPFLLLAYLALAGNWVAREQLAALFWPDSPEGDARRNLRRLVSRLDELPFGHEVEVEATRLRWAVGTDVHAFLAALGAGSWATAVELYRGELLAGSDAAAGTGFGDWLELERQRLLESWKDAATERIVELEAAGGYGPAAELAGRILEGDPLAEEALRLYMRNAYAAGRRQAALQAYGRFAALLAAEMELEPEDETRQLAELIGHAAAGTETSLPAPVRPRERVPLELLRPPQLVGRAGERHRLHGAETPVILLAGEPGVGKTRLLTDGLGDEVLYCRCLEGLELVPYHPLASVIRERMRQGLPLPDLGEYLQDLARLVPELSERPAAPEPEGARGRLLEAFARYLDASGTTLLIDDLQWADQATLELIVYLAARGRPRIRGAYRSTEVGEELRHCLDSLGSAGALEIVNLPPLAADEVLELLTLLTGQGEPPELFSIWLHGMSGGNPMFALETLKSLFESRVLRLDRDDWRTPIDDLTRDYSELPAPSAVRDVIRRRVQRLDAETQRVLRAAAVLASDAAVAPIAGLAGLDEWRVLECLETLNLAGLLRDSAFTHDLLRQSVYEDMTPSVRNHLHLAAARELAGSAEPLVLAAHWFAAGDDVAAAGHWLEGAQRLARAGLFEDALRIVEDALARDLPASVRWPLENVAVEALRNMTRYEEAAARAQYLIDACPDPSLRARAWEALGWAHVAFGRFEEAENCGRQALELIPDDDPAGIRHELSSQMAAALYYQGRYAEAEAVLLPSLEILKRDGDPDQLSVMYSNLASIREATAGAASVLELHREAVRLARLAGARHMEVNAVCNLLGSLNVLGRAEEGIEMAREALALGLYDASDMLRANLALGLLQLGEADEAVVHLEYLVKESVEASVRAMAWGRLAGQRAGHGEQSGVHEAVDEALALGLAAEPAFHACRAYAAIAVLQHGTAEQLARCAEILDTLDSASLTKWLRGQFEEAWAARFGAG